MEFTKFNDVNRLAKLHDASSTVMREYERFYEGHAAMLESNAFYRAARDRASACAARMRELEQTECFQAAA